VKVTWFQVRAVWLL
jgi:hypothetical protein